MPQEPTEEEIDRLCADLNDLLKRIAHLVQHTPTSKLEVENRRLKNALKNRQDEITELKARIQELESSS